jgi:hypothetical protein
MKYFYRITLFQLTSSATFHLISAMLSGLMTINNDKQYWQPNSTMSKVGKSTSLKLLNNWPEFWKSWVKMYPRQQPWSKVTYGNSLCQKLQKVVIASYLTILKVFINFYDVIKTLLIKCFVAVEFKLIECW